MARLPRIVVPGVAHHVTQRGNRRQQVFFDDGDYELYLDLMAESCRANGVEVWSYCLMPNHVHLAMVPEDDGGLSRAVGEAHRRYSAYINAKLRVTGHLFQGRFGCVAMDEAHLLAAIRYIALNPVKAKLVQHAVEWTWSSARALAAGTSDRLVRAPPVLERTGPFEDFLGQKADAELESALLRGQSIGRPLMPMDELKALERQLGIAILPRKRGRRPKASEDGQQQLV